ncbi:MAG: TIGR03435 family protein [Terriglobales bacterium]
MTKALKLSFPACTLAALLALAGAAASQQTAAAPAAAPATLAFDVASIKPAPDIATVIASKQIPHLGTHIDAGRVDIGFASLQDLICTAYAVKPYQVSGPDWTSRERFDILATLPQGATKDQVPQMLQTLLAQRFHLVLHRDTHSLPVYALAVDQGGPKLPPAEAEAAAPAAPAPGATSVDTPDGKVTMTQSRSPSGATTVMTSGGKGGPMQITMQDGELQLQGARMSMAAFAEMLSGMMDRPVLDQTGLDGLYQVKLGVTKEDLQAIARAAMLKMGMPPPPQTPGVASAPGGSSIFASVRKLGLKLEPRDAPIERIVIDSMDKQPTAN